MSKLLLFLFTALVLSAQVRIPGPGGVSAGGAEPVLTHIQGALGSTVSTGTTIVSVLGSNPTAGNAVACAFVYYNPTGINITGVQDANGNAYTQDANSPEVTQTSARGIGVWYLLNAPANADKTITATTSGAITFSSNGRCEEFHRASGSWTRDTSAKANATGIAGSTINTPSATPSVSAELCYAATTTSSAAFITGVAGGWTQDAGGIEPSIGQDNGEYILSCAGSTAVNFSMNTTGATYNAIMLVLK